MGVPRAVALVLATGLARHPAGLSALAFSKIGCCGVGRSAEIRTRDPQSPRHVVTVRHTGALTDPKLLASVDFSPFLRVLSRYVLDRHVTLAEHDCYVTRPLPLERKSGDMAKALTARGVENVKAEDQRREIPDGLLRGLYLAGAAQWRKELGRPLSPQWHYAQATRSAPFPRSIWHTLVGPLERHCAPSPKGEIRVLKGRKPDPPDRTRSRRSRPLSSRTTAGGGICPRTADETARLLKLHVLPHWRSRHILVDLSARRARPARRSHCHRITRSGESDARGRAVDVSNWAMSNDIVTASPCAGMTRPTPRDAARSRLYRTRNSSRRGAPLVKLGFPFGPLVQLLVLTGQRRDEVAGMRWSEINLGREEVDAPTGESEK